MGYSGRVVGFADDCFADDLIKMSRDHFSRQGARVTRVVKIAHAGRALARRREMEKEAIGTAGVIGKMTGAISKAVKGASPGIKKIVGKPAGTGMHLPVKKPTAMPSVSRPKPAAPLPQQRAPAPGPQAPTPRPGQAGGVAARPIQQVGAQPTTARPNIQQPVARPAPAAPQQAAPQRPPAAQAPPGGQAPPPQQAAPQPSAAPAKQIPTDQGAASVPTDQGAAVPKPGVARRAIESGKQVVGGGLHGAQGAPEGGGLWAKGMNWLGRGAMGAFGHGPDTASNLIGSAARLGGSRAAGFVSNLRAGRALNKNVAGSLKRVSNKPVQSADAIAGMGLGNIGQEGAQFAAQLKMSPRQVQALDQLQDLSRAAQGGANVPRSARKQLERASGVSMQDLNSYGGVENVLRNRAGGAGAVAVAGGPGGPGLVDAAGGVAGSVVGGGGDQPSGRAGRAGMLSGMGGTALKVGVPLAGGLAAYGAYSGMQGLAERNRTTQYQHGAQGAPVNYSPTAMFPAGQVRY